MNNTQTENGQGHRALGKVYFIVSMLPGITLGYDMRGDFPAHTRGTRDLDTVMGWKSRLEAENAHLRGELHIMATPSFVLNERAPLEVVHA